MYPCPCGYYGDSVKACISGYEMITKYRKRISGLLLDGSDIQENIIRTTY